MCSRFSSWSCATLLTLALAATLAAEEPPRPFPGPLPPLELAEAERKARAGDLVEARRTFERLTASADAAVAAGARAGRDRAARAQEAWTRLAQAFGRLRSATLALPPDEHDLPLAHLFGPDSHPGSVVDPARYDAEFAALAALPLPLDAPPAAVRAVLGAARALVLYGAVAPPNYLPARADRLLQAERLVHQALVAPDAAWRDAICGRLRDFTEFAPALWEEIVRRAPHPSPGDPGTYAEEYEVPYDRSSARYHLFVPATYRPSRPCPLLVTLHPTGGQGQAMLGWWRSLAGDQGYLLLAPTATAFRTKGWGKTELERACILAAIDHVRARFAVDPDRTYLTGYSMGGHASWDLGIEFADRWAGILPMAGAPFGIAEGRLQSLLALPIFSYYGLYDSAGNAGGIAGRNQEATRILEKLGADLTVVEDQERGHMLELTHAHALSWYGWMDRKTRTVWPALVRAVLAPDGPRRAYWICPTLPPGGKWPTPDPTRSPPPAPFVRAEIKPGNRIQVYGDHLGDFDCWLGGPELDLAAPVRLSLDGKTVFEGAKPRDLGVLLRLAAESGDHGRLFWNVIRVRGGKGE
ncbi:MAG: hypothetical protein HZA54_03465 [Planctomycetes bacterium]|nr:hypothetical protein [Planctomycetota bacterium]